MSIISVICHNYMVNSSKYREEFDSDTLKFKEQLSDSKKFEERFNTLYDNYERLREKFLAKSAEFELKEYDYKQTILEKDQAKISFALEQLEKVKEKLSSMQWCIGSEKNTLVQIIAHRAKQNDILDNQIKQLKEGK